MEQLAGRTRDVLEQNTVYGNSCHSRFDYVLSARLLSCKQMRFTKYLNRTSPDQSNSCEVRHPGAPMKTSRMRNGARQKVIFLRTPTAHWTFLLELPASCSRRSGILSRAGSVSPEVGRPACRLSACPRRSLYGVGAIELIIQPLFSVCLSSAWANETL